MHAVFIGVTDLISTTILKPWPHVIPTSILSLRTGSHFVLFILIVISIPISKRVKKMRACFEAAHHVCDNGLGKALHQLNLMRHSHDWQNAKRRTLPHIGRAMSHTEDKRNRDCIDLSEAGEKNAPQGGR